MTNDRYQPWQPDFDQRRRSRRPARGVEPAAGASLPRHRPPLSLRAVGRAHVRVGGGAGATRRGVRTCRPARGLPGLAAARARRRARRRRSGACRGTSSCGPASGRSPGRSGCAWCAPRSSPTVGVALRAFRDRRPRARDVGLAGRARADGDDTVLTMHLAYDGRAVDRRRCSSGARRRDPPGAGQRWCELLEPTHVKRPSARRSSVSGIAEALAERRRRSSARSIGPGRRHDRACSSSACVVPGGISSTWWVTTTNGGRSGSAARSSSAATSCSRPPRSRRGGRLVEQDHRRVVHQRPGQQHALALARRQRAERPRRRTRRRPCGRGSRPRRSSSAAV